MYMNLFCADTNYSSVCLLRLQQVSSCGAAARDGRLLVGMRILEVNNHSLLGMTHTEAVRVLRAVGDSLVMLVCDGFDANKVSVVEVRPLEKSWHLKKRVVAIVSKWNLVSRNMNLCVKSVLKTDQETPSVLDKNLSESYIPVVA